MTTGTESHPNQQIGERLRFLREHFDLSQKEMAARCGVSLSTYNNWETGLKRLSLDGARRIKGLFQVSLDFLYFAEPNALPANLANAWLSRP